MKKIKYLIATLILAICLTSSALAVTPTYKPPKMPDMSDIKIEVNVPKLDFQVKAPKVNFPAGYFDNLFKNFKIDMKNIK